MYEAILFALDGAYTFDFRRDTVEEVEQELADMGSRWYFYPVHAVIRCKPMSHGYHNRQVVERQTLASVAYPFEEFTGKRVGTFLRHIESIPDSEWEALLT